MTLSMRRLMSLTNKHPNCIKRETCQLECDDCIHAQYSNRFANAPPPIPPKPLTPEERIQAKAYERHRELVDAQNRIADAAFAQAEATDAIAAQTYWSRITNWGRP